MAQQQHDPRTPADASEGSPTESYVNQSFNARLLAAASVFAEHASMRLLRRSAFQIEQDSANGAVRAEWEEIGPLGKDHVSISFTPTGSDDRVRIVKTSVIEDFSGPAGGTEEDRIVSLAELEAEVGAYPPLSERLREFAQLVQDVKDGNLE